MLNAWFARQGLQSTPAAFDSASLDHEPLVGNRCTWALPDRAEIVFVLVVAARLICRPTGNPQHGQRNEASRLIQKAGQASGELTVHEDSKVGIVQRQPLGGDAGQECLAHQARMWVTQGVEQTVTKDQKARRLT